jgi:hypothetical protein
MTISYMCPWCNETFEDVVKVDRHKTECPERPLNDVRDDA